MKAIGINQYGEKNVLLEMDVKKPVIGKHQVLIKSHAASVNPIDWIIRKGTLKDDSRYDWSFPITLGFDVAGTIVERGTEVVDWQLDERVFARKQTTPEGSYAEYVAVDIDLLAKIPENSSFIEAAAIPLAGLTAWQALFDKGQLQVGERVLVHGGAGGVGSFAVQFAKSYGATVLATASSRNQTLLEELGVDQFIDYQKQDFSKELSEIDLVIDTVGGKVFQDSFEVLTPNIGRIVTIVGSAVSLATPANAAKFTLLNLETNGSQLQEIASLVNDKKVKPLVGSVFPFTRQGIYDAHELSESRRARGKIVISFGS